MRKNNIKKLIISIVFFLGFFVSFNNVLAVNVVKQIGQTFLINASCSDGDANLSKCEVISPSPCTKTCGASGASGSCSCSYTCGAAVTISTKGRATDALGLITDFSGPTIICDSLPVVDAGPDKEVFEGESVGLDGSATDADGDSLSYSWSCNGGSLSDSSLAKPNFNSSAVSADQNYTCTLTATDTKGGSASDSMNVKVINTLLSISLVADKTSGNSPLTDVSLTATVLPSSTARGTTADYYFWCNCSYTGTNVNTAIVQCGNWTKRVLGDNPTSYVAQKLCNYTDAAGGRYTPKVIINKGLADSAQATTLITTGRNNPPTVSNLGMTPPPPGCETDCSLCKEIPPLTPIFSWKFTDDEGDYQTAFEIWLTDKDGNIIKINSSERNGGSQNYAVENGLLQYSNSYQWKIRVADSGGIYSDWVSFDGGIYNTPIGSFPTPNFDFSPENPQLGKEVNFTDKSTASDGAEILNWEWSFPNASLSNKKTAENPLILTYNQETNINPEVIFYVKDKDQKVTLRVVDTNGLSCSVEKFLNITNVLPRWREIIPW